jgi:hypothetical protein
LNIDFSKYSGHVYYGVAAKKFEHAYLKIRQVELYNELIASFPTSSDLAATSASYAGKIKDVKDSFTQYERTVWSTSGSYTWPRTGTILTSYSASATQTWYNEQIASASAYDKANPHSLYNNAPELMTVEDSSKHMYSLMGV